MSEQAAAFDALIQEFYDVWLRYHPAEAEMVGIGNHRGLLPPMDDDEMGALTSWLESLLVGLEELDYFALDKDRQLEHQIVFRAVQRELQNLMEQDWRRRDPLRFLPFEAVFQLTLRPGDSLRDDLVSLLTQIPEYLRRGKHHLSSVPGLVSRQAVEAALAECQSGAMYLRRLGKTGLVEHHFGDTDRVRTLCDNAAAAVSSFGAFLEKELATDAAGHLGCGRHDYERILWQEHFLDMAVEKLEPILAKEFADTQARLEEEAASRSIPSDPRSVVQYLSRLPKHFGEVRREVYQQENKALQEFLHARDLLPLPDRGLRIHGKPVCPRYGLCESLYVGINDVHNEGVLYLAEDAESGREQGEPRTWIRDRCAELGWTGRHLLESAGSPAARSAVRLMNPSSSMQRGWLLYIRQLLREQEYGDGDDVLARLLYLLQGIKLAQIELSLHFRLLGFDDAARDLSEYEPEPARARRTIFRLLQNPAKEAASVISWLLISTAREQVVEDRKTMPLREFHDAILQHGSVPVPLLLTRAFGPDIWREAKQRLLS